MQPVVPTSFEGRWRSFALGAAAALVCASALLPQGLPVLVAAALCAAMAAPAALQRQPAALAPLLPPLALLVDQPALAWPLLAAWTISGCLLPLALYRAGTGTAPPPSPARLVGKAPAPADESREISAMRRDRDMLAQHLRRYPRLLEACLELAAAREPDQLADTLCEETRRLIPGVATVQVFIGTGPKIHSRAAWAEAGENLAEAPGAAAHYVLNEARTLVRRHSGRVQAVFPLRSERRGRAMGNSHRGVLVVSFQSRGTEDQLLLDLLIALSRIGGLGLASADLLAEARSLALHDDLTGLFGRHEFLRRVQEQVAAARRDGHGLGLIMCDMDRLKKFNDRWGHQAGDEALRLVAQAIRSQLPEGAGACRFGGEEFAVFVPGAGASTTGTVAAKIHHAIGASAVDPERRVTASLGWAVLREQEECEQLLERADQACYRAKAGGRDRVEADDR